MVSGYLATKDFTVGPAKTSEADRLVNGRLVEVKFSTQWENGVYKFQQIRDQGYDLLFCLGVSPFDAHAWVFPKTVVTERMLGKMGQHGGSDASETAWLSVNPRAPERWLAPYGGRLTDAVAVLRRLAPPG